MDDDRIDDSGICCCDLGGISLPSYTESIKRQRLRVVVEAVVSDLRLAKADAFEQGARGSSTVEFTVTGGDATTLYRYRRHRRTAGDTIQQWICGVNRDGDNRFRRLGQRRTARCHLHG